MTTDVVCILDANLAQVLQTARPIKATVHEEAKAMEHPLETGASVVDHVIISPVGIDLSMVLSGAEFRQTYQAIRELFYRRELLTVQTMTGSYPSMCITAMPHEESPDVANGTNLALTLTEVRFVSAQFSEASVKKARDGKTVKRGAQQATEPATPRQKSILSGLFR